MTVEEFYKSIGEDYGEVLRRIGSDERIVRFLWLLPGNAALRGLDEAMKRGDAAKASENAVSFKDACLDLGLTELAGAVERLNERLSADNPFTVAVWDAFAAFKTHFTKIVSLLPPPPRKKPFALCR